MTDREYNMKVANTILQQLGGNRFLTMTGSDKLTVINNGLRMNLRRNKSKANMLEIKLNPMDEYEMEFKKFIPGKLNKKTYEYSEAKIETVKRYDGVYFDMLQEIFTSETGMYTKLF